MKEKEHLKKKNHKAINTNYFKNNKKCNLNKPTKKGEEIEVIADQTETIECKLRTSQEILTGDRDNQEVLKDIITDNHMDKEDKTDMRTGVTEDLTIRGIILMRVVEHKIGMK